MSVAAPETPIAAAQALPVLPLKNSVLLPEIMLPIAIGRPASVATIEAALAREDKALIVVAQRDASIEQPEPKDLFTVGCKAIITDFGKHLPAQPVDRVDYRCPRPVR